MLARFLWCIVPLLTLAGCFSDNGRTYFLDPISGPAYLLSGDEYETLTEIPGILSVGDRNYENTIYVTFYPSTGERIASSPFKRDYAPEFGAVDASFTYQKMITHLTEVCGPHIHEKDEEGNPYVTLETASGTGPTYNAQVRCRVQ